MNRRGNGGYKIINGILYVYGNIDGKRYRLSTKKEANKQNISYIKKNHHQVLLQLIEQKNSVPIQKIETDLKNFSYKVLELSAHKRSKETQQDYLSKLDRLILPYFENYKISDIKTFDIETFQKELLSNNSTITVKRVILILDMILRKAVSYDIIQKNPVEYVEKFTITYQKKKPYTKEEIIKILSHSKGELKVFLSLGFLTGMRTGELLGLKWKDIDFDKKIITLERSHRKGKTISSNEIKNHNRIVYLPKQLVNILLEYKQNAKSDEWLFVSKFGKPYYESKPIAKKFKKLLKELDIEWKKLMTTRHSFISLLRNYGVSSDLVSEIAGHSKIVEDKHYFEAQISKEKHNKINNAFSKLFGHN